MPISQSTLLGLQIRKYDPQLGEKLLNRNKLKNDSDDGTLKRSSGIHLPVLRSILTAGLEKPQCRWN